MRITEDYRNIFAKNPDFVVFDTETTGFSGEHDRIIELGAVSTTTVDGIIEPVMTRGSLIKPDKEIKNSKIHGITDEMVKDKPEFKAVVPGFLKMIEGDCVLVAHNAQFDIRMMKGEFLRNEIEFPDKPVICTMKLCKMVFPGLKSYSQINIAAHLGISVENAHRAVDDSLVCLEILKRCIEEMNKNV